MAEYIKHTADDEEVDCGRCDFNDTAIEYCLEFCGAEHAWGCYCRLECVEDEGRRT